jgi:hypothetical protein
MSQPRQLQALSAWQDRLNRRTFLARSACGLGIAALGALDAERSAAATSTPSQGLETLPHFAPKAKRVIYLFQSGAPSQMELFDHKPTLAGLSGQNLPDSIRMGQRLTGMTSVRRRFRWRLPLSSSGSMARAEFG